MNAFLWRGSVLLILILICFPSSARVEQPPNGGAPVREGNSFRFVAQGEYRGQLTGARDSTLHAAQDQLRDWLGKQNPPIQHVPSLDTMRREMLLREHPPHEETVLSDTMYKVAMEFELTPVQIRSLRSSDRTAVGLWILVGITAILGVLSLFFRVDEWTKGYLTRWLIVAGALIVAACGFALARTQ